MYTIQLSQHPTPEEVRHAISTIGHIAGETTMKSVAASFMQSAQPAPQATAVDKTAAEVFTAPGVDRAPPPPPHGVDRDSKGLPWDARIHSSTKGTNQDGSWKKRRNIDDATVASVEAELRGVTGKDPLDLPDSLRRTATPPPPPAAGAAPPPPPPAAEAGALTFGAIMTKTTQLIAQKKMTQPQTVEAAQAVGVDNTIALAKRPDLWQSYSDVLDAYAAGAA